MRRIRIRRGLDLPLAGAARSDLQAAPAVQAVALLGGDAPGVRARLKVAEGEAVHLGQPLFEDRREPRIVFPSPGTGVVEAIVRGPRRALVAVVVRLRDAEEGSFVVCEPVAPTRASREQVIRGLLASGLWTALRTRPFGRVPRPDERPASIFVTAMGSEPLAPSAACILATDPDAFVAGLAALVQLDAPRVFLCHRDGERIPGADVDGVEAVAFAGPHPAGLPGTHIHHLDPVRPGHTAWHLGYQDVMALGGLFTTGRASVERVVALGGPPVRDPRLLRTRIGASTDDLVRGELVEGPSRVISGSVLSGREAVAPLAYLGRLHDQVCVLAEGAGMQTRSARTRCRFRGRLAGRFTRARPLTTALGGRGGVLWPLEGLERLVPLDGLVAPLLRALVVGDEQAARALGCLELVEEDLALCTFACPGKLDYGVHLRALLERIEKEG